MSFPGRNNPDAYIGSINDASPDAQDIGELEHRAPHIADSEALRELKQHISHCQELGPSNAAPKLHAGVATRGHGFDLRPFDQRTESDARLDNPTAEQNGESRGYAQSQATTSRSPKVS